MEALSSLDRPVGWLPIHAIGARSVRRCVRGLAIDERVAAEVRDRAVLVATELATNLERHAVGGELFVTACPKGFDLLALDTGPGIADLEAAMRPGFSTAGGLGDGMGAIHRLSDSVRIETGPQGTLIAARVGPEDPLERTFGVVERAFPPGYVNDWSSPSGDGWRLVTDGRHSHIIVLDALGHGRRAAHAKETALTAGSLPASPEEALEIMARAIGTGRGAVAGVARIDHVERRAEIAVVGNIAARIVGPSHPHRVASKDGILGPRLPSLRTETVPLPPGHTLLMHTDGVSARRPVQVPAHVSARMHAAHVYRAGARATDDACVLAFRLPEASP